MEDAMQYDFARLRMDLKEYYTNATAFGFSRKLIETDLKRIDDADDAELLEIAREDEFDISGYTIV